MASVVLGGPELADFSLSEPAASVRVLLPSTPGADLVIPVWRGNEFLLPNGERPVIRTLTPRRFDAIAAELEVQIVVHDGGAASRWVSAAAPGDPAAMSGPGRGYRIDADAAGFLLVGDETAIPAIAQLLEWMPPAIGRRGAHRGRRARGRSSPSDAGSNRGHLASSRARRGSRRRARRGSRFVDDRGWLEDLGRGRGRCDVPHPAPPLRRARLATRPRHRPRVLEARPSRRRRHGRRIEPFAQSGRRESNPRSQLGKLMFCR